jgi:hypothetical protein
MSLRRTKAEDRGAVRVAFPNRAHLRFGSESNPVALGALAAECLNEKCLLNPLPLVLPRQNGRAT